MFAALGRRRPRIGPSTIRLISRFFWRPFVSFNFQNRRSGRYASTAARPAKTKGKKTTLQLSELTQGLLPSDASDPAPAAEPEQTGGYPLVIQQAINNMHKFKNCVVLTRVGAFYELYAEQATSIGSLLNLKVASKKTSVGRVPMAGFPFFQLERYLKILVQDHGRHVAISEQAAVDAATKVKNNGNMFDRQVTRVITPGTLIDEHFLTPYEHNYLLAVYLDPHADIHSETALDTKVGLTWLDLSSGDFFVQTTGLGSLESAIARIGPREIIVESGLDANAHLLKPLFAEQRHMLSFSDTAAREISDDEIVSMLENATPNQELDDFTAEERRSSHLLLDYVQNKLPGLPLRLQAPIRHKTENYMDIDKNSLRGLEVTQTMKDGAFKGSLLHAIRRTSTESGARLLCDRLTSPSMALPVINHRLDLVGTFLRDPVLLEESTDLLKQTDDTVRLIQKFSLGRGSAEDLLGLSRTITLTQSVHALLVRGKESTPECLRQLSHRFNLDGPAELADRISSAIDEDGLMLRQRHQDLAEAQAVGMARTALEADADSADMAKLSKRLQSKKFDIAEGQAEGQAESNVDDGEIWIMRRDATSNLQSLHNSLRDLLAEKGELEASLRRDLDANSLTLRWTPGLTYFGHLKGRDTKVDLTLAPEGCRVISASRSTVSFNCPPWSRLGSRIEEAKLRIRAAEAELFTTLRDQVIKNLVVLRRNAAVLDDIDVAGSFAQLAAEHDLVRPRLNSGTAHRVHGGRHLMVERGLVGTRGNAFTPNDCILGGSDARIWLVTGPNMAGKSTFLRQTALLSILAQSGSFVPAAHADVGLVDAIFSRIGSADNTSQDQSTFMVEMLETAHILRHATPRSLVVMDEVGRGTTPEDGTAVGYAALRHLHDVNGCRALFATHFHRLSELTQDLPGIERWCTGVVDEGGGVFRYDHRLRRGVNRDSHALKVARLARMPEAVVRDAEACLARLKSEA